LLKSSWRGGEGGIIVVFLSVVQSVGVTVPCVDEIKNTQKNDSRGKEMSSGKSTKIEDN
jgi:hypothetical protein